MNTPHYPGIQTATNEYLAKQIAHHRQCIAWAMQNARESRDRHEPPSWVLGWVTYARTHCEYLRELCREQRARRKEERPVPLF